VSGTPNPCWSIYAQYLPDQYNQIPRELEDYIKNPYRVDPSLKIEKARGLCKPSTEKNNFCLFTEVGIDMFEQLDVYIVEDWKCKQLSGVSTMKTLSFPVYLMLPGIPYPLVTNFAAHVGYSRLYVLNPGKTYVISYVRRGDSPLAKVKKFEVIDPDHVEVLREWSCDKPECLKDVPDVVKEMCEEGMVRILGPEPKGR
jgi:hypothetical protein